MNDNQIIALLYEHSIEIFQKCDDRHFGQYFLIRDKFSNRNFDKEFEGTFCNFYILNGPGGLTTKQKEVFFELLSSGEGDLDRIIQSLYNIPGYRERHCFYLSFGTKLLHTLENRLPIYDHNIATVLDLPSQTNTGSFEDKLNNRKRIYLELIQRFDGLLAKPEMADCLQSARISLRKLFEVKSLLWRDELVSDTKLLDSLLWALYSVTRKNHS